MVKPPKETVFQVSELTWEIKSLLEGRFFSVAVQGEISSLSSPYSGHKYFTLKDSKAQISCAFFKQAASRCPFELEEGMEVIVRGKISVYEPRGAYQLIVQQVEPVGEGALQLAYEQLKNKLEAQGLFAKEHKKEIPWLPNRIGVITSPTGAAIQDVLQILNRRAPNVPVLIYPALVQGNQAPAQLKEGLEALASREGIDLIILTRGGGSLEDLWGFNDEALAQAIFDCPVPVISAVGHETDFTIADFVADLRAPTPSAAAELAVPVRDELVAQIDQLTRQATRALNNQINSYKNKLEHFARRLRNPEGVILSQIQRKDELDLRLQRAMNHWFAHKHTQLKLATHQLESFNPQRTLSSNQEKVTELSRRLQFSVTNKLNFKRQFVANLAHRLESASPLSAFKRGYSIAKNAEGRVVHSASNINTGDFLTVHLEDGEVNAQVTDVKLSPPSANTGQNNP